MHGSKLLGYSAILVGSLALGSTSATAGGGECCCCHGVYTLPLLFSNPVQTSFVYYPSWHHRWPRASRAHCGWRHCGRRHW